VLVRIKNWERYGLKSWIEAAKRRLHHNVLAIALANKLARIAWAVLAKDAPSTDEDRRCRRRQPRDPRDRARRGQGAAGNAGASRKQARRRP